MEVLYQPDPPFAWGRALISIPRKLIYLAASHRMSGSGSKGDIAAAFGHVRSTPLTGRRAIYEYTP
jgi:hypothetical protein